MYSPNSMEAYYLREILKEIVKLRMEIRDLMPVPQGQITSSESWNSQPEQPTQQEEAEDKKTKFKKKKKEEE